MNEKDEVREDVLIVTIDISAKALKQTKPFSTGKTKLIASTNGFVSFGDVRMSLNATIPSN